MATTDDAIQEMLDEFALRKLVHSYCRAVDRGDTEQLRDLYHSDATDDHGAFSSGGASDFLAQLTAARPYLRAMQHHITTANFAVDGTLAEGEVYTIAIHTLPATGRDIDVIVGGRYLDKYEKYSGTWRFAERSVVTDWARVDEPSALDMSHPITRDTLTGALDATDPSFAFFTMLHRRR
jgi:ketosteroid isomerase-like protein